MNKRWIFCSIIAVCLLVAAAGGDAAEEKSSFIENGGFETGDVLGWTGYGFCQLEIVTDDVFEGQYACKVWLDQEWGGGLYTKLHAPRGLYRVIMRIKPGPGTGQCWAGADEFGAEKISIPVRETGKWEEVVFSLRILKNTCVLYTYTPRANGWILVDAVKVMSIGR